MLEIASPSEKILAFTAAREGLCLRAHWDSTRLAIGFGENRDDLKEGDTITLDEALARYVANSAHYAADVNKVFKGVPLKQHQWDALFSLTYNIGGTELRKCAALQDAVRKYCSLPKPVTKQEKADYSTARRWVAHWIHMAKYSPVTGPHNPERRAAETLVFSLANYGDISKVPYWSEEKNPKPLYNDDGTVRVAADDPDMNYPMPTFLKVAA